MALSREVNLRLNWVLNELVPPVIRDARWFGWCVTWLLYRRQARIYMDFHARAYGMSEAEFAATYRDIQATALKRPMDVNRASLALIEAHAVGETVLEAGCGRGYLSGLLAARFCVTGCDVALAEGIAARYPGVTFVESAAEHLPFADGAFDTVISTHMLEHVRDLPGVLKELRRVCRRRLILVVPCERPHCYTPNLHLHFFPYAYSLLLALQPEKGRYFLQKAGGDWFFYEDRL